jgi:hypothetical protein
MRRRRHRGPVTAATNGAVLDGAAVKVVFVRRPRHLKLVLLVLGCRGGLGSEAGVESVSGRRLVLRDSPIVHQVLVLFNLVRIIDKTLSSKEFREQAS